MADQDKTVLQIESGSQSHPRNAPHELSETGAGHAPGHFVPADDTENARLIFSQIVPDTMKFLKMSHPDTSRVRRRELSAFRETPAN